MKMAKIQTRNQNKDVYLTTKGLVEIKDELELLKKIKRPKVTQRIQIAREFGDLTENSEYDAALEEQTMVENRIIELENILSNAQIISVSVKSDFVVIGSTVIVEMGGEIDEFTIVGKMEADPTKKRISNESPVGSALLGTKPGEEVEVSTPIVRYKCKVLEIK